MKYSASRDTAAPLLEEDLPGVASGEPFTRTHVGLLKFPTSGTSALVPEETEQETEDQIFPAIPRKAARPDMVRGKSLAQWGIERRRAARALREKWRDEVSPAVGSTAFAVRASAFVDTLDGLMRLYTGIDCEEVFAGMLQLIRDALIGSSFVDAEEGRFDEAIMSVLDMGEGSRDLSLAVYDEALDKFIEAGVRHGLGG